MGNYFLQGGDWDNAIKYYTKPRKLGMEQLEVVLCRNMANAFKDERRQASTEKLLVPVLPSLIIKNSGVGFFARNF